MSGSLHTHICDIDMKNVADMASDISEADSGLGKSCFDQDLRELHLLHL